MVNNLRDTIMHIVLGVIDKGIVTGKDLDVYEGEITAAIEADRLSSEGGGSETTGGWVECSERSPERSGMRVGIINIGIPDDSEKFRIREADFIRGKFHYNGHPWNPSHWHKLPSIYDLTPPKGNKGEESE